jgi:LysM repeat protein
MIIPRIDLKILVGLLLCLLFFNDLTVYAVVNYPGAALFDIQCGSSAITFIYKGTPALQARFSQIATPLATAISTQQNQQIAYGNGVSLWALKSNELQVHLDSNPDGTKLVVSSGICGQIPNVQPSTGYPYSNGQAAAFAQTYGAGQAAAYAGVTPYGQAFAYAMTSGAGQAYAYAQSSPNYGIPPAGASRAYIVQPGDNLFRIALRNNVPLQTVMTLNNISNPALIYVGQTIYLP